MEHNKQKAIYELYSNIKSIILDTLEDYNITKTVNSDKLKGILFSKK